jgi:hypothetical protein
VSHDLRNVLDQCCLSLSARLPTVPLISDLKTCLETPLSIRVPVNQLYFTQEHCESVIPCTTNNEYAFELSRVFENVLSEGCLQPTGGSEDTYHHQHDAYIGDIFKLLGKRCLSPILCADRNRSDLLSPSSLSKTNLRPDFSVWMDNRLLLIGEEKAIDFDFPKAVVDLKTKSVSWYDTMMQENVPYRLAYAGTERRIQFFAISPKDELIPISNLFSTQFAGSRMSIVRCVFNLFRIMRTIALDRLNIPAYSVLPLYFSVIRPNSIITRKRDYVEKRILSEFVRMCSISVENLTRLYAMLCHAPHCIQLLGSVRSQTAGDIILKLQPCGLQIAPSTEEELKLCIRMVLEALAFINTHGWIHRDLRWPNIIKVGESWLLIDFETAIESMYGLTYGQFIKMRVNKFFFCSKLLLYLVPFYISCLR